VVYDKELKNKVEALALKYYNSKDNVSSQKLSELEGEVVKAVENYVFSSALRNRPQYIADDARQSIRIGIINAIRKYDPTKGTFCTWVIWQVKDTVNRDKASQWIRVPAYMKDNVRKLQRFEEEWIASNKRRPTDQEILDNLGWSDIILKRARHVIGLQNGDLLDERAKEYADHDIVDRSSMKVDVSRAIEELDPRQKQIVKWHYFVGLDLAEIARRLKISPQRVQEILKEAERSLSGILKDYA
jgi:RNA polymerase sigma factor (sigma-70 family)